MWGQFCRMLRTYYHNRFTPTHVGTMDAPWCALSPVSVHPHACGDNLASGSAGLRPAGSPPRMWGQLLSPTLWHFVIRFTPTHVGTMIARIGALGAPAVHPHACGDNACSSSNCLSVSGSPPRMWGQSIDPPVFRRDTRFTPTHVGTIGIGMWEHEILPVHPHACGDNIEYSSCFNEPCGSPPRMWGQLRLFCRNKNMNRFTPTHVGTIAR